MILVDTSVWIDYFGGATEAGWLEALLEKDLVMIHSWVIGELALGRLGDRREQVLANLGLLPRSPALTHEEIRVLIDARGLAGSGIGLVHAHLVGAALIAEAKVWTHDKRLLRVVRALGIEARSPAESPA